MTVNVSLVYFEIGVIKPFPILMTILTPDGKSASLKPFLIVSAWEPSELVASSHTMADERFEKPSQELTTSCSSTISICFGMLILMIAPYIAVLANLVAM